MTTLDLAALRKCRGCDNSFLPKPWQIKGCDFRCPECHRKIKKTYKDAREKSGNPLKRAEGYKEYLKQYRKLRSGIKREPLTQDALRQNLHYDQNSGVFTRLKNGGGKSKAGTIAGFIDPEGYRKIGVLGVQYKAHHLAFFYMTGSLPSMEIDHINGVRDDNSWKNLREVTRTQNSQNAGVRKKRSGIGSLKGTSFIKKSGKWIAQIKVNGKHKLLGHFLTEQEAHNSYRVAAEKFFGEYTRYGIEREESANG